MLHPESVENPGRKESTTVFRLAHLALSAFIRSECVAQDLRGSSSTRILNSAYCSRNSAYCSRLLNTDTPRRTIEAVERNVAIAVEKNKVFTNERPAEFIWQSAESLSLRRVK